MPVTLTLEIVILYRGFLFIFVPWINLKVCKKNVTINNTDTITLIQHNIINSDKTLDPKTFTYTDIVTPNLVLIYWRLVIDTNLATTNSAITGNFLYLYIVFVAIG